MGTNKRAGWAPPREEPVNVGLYRAHRAVLIIYSILGSFVIVVCVGMTVSGKEPHPVNVIGAFLAPVLAIGHWFAARGARRGRRSGRIASWLFGFILLFAFPVGTLVGAFILFKSIWGWRGADGDQEPTQPEAALRRG